MNYDGFKTEILMLAGIDLGSYKEKQMKRRIDSLIRKNGYNSYMDYVIAIKKDKKLYDEFINYLTINVSEFYRNPEQWEVLEKEIFPMLLEKTNKLKIWSTACSTGDEPYTLAMVLNNYVSLDNIKILASDIDKRALEKAKAGVYSYKSLEKLPKKYLNKHFIKLDENYQIKDEIKNCIQFSRHNLLKDEYPYNCDLLVCRNVLIYFTEEAKIDIYKKFNKALKTGGVLFVGSTEQILMPGKYNLNSIRTFFYSKEKGLE